MSNFTIKFFALMSMSFGVFIASLGLKFLCNIRKKDSFMAEKLSHYSLFFLVECTIIFIASLVFKYLSEYFSNAFETVAIISEIGLNPLLGDVCAFLLIGIIVYKCILKVFDFFVLNF